MIKHRTEPTSINTILIKKSNYYECPECLIHFAAAPKFCWFCGAAFTNLSECTEVFPREEENE